MSLVGRSVNQIVALASDAQVGRQANPIVALGLAGEFFNSLVGRQAN